MKKYLILLCSALTFLSCSAQQKVSLPEIPPPPAITVSKLGEGESAIRLSEVKVDVKVIGPMAVTTLDMIFYNPNNRILEGEFQFPLGEGQNISRFALDINGKLREGVVVEKAKGQEVFESVIRQNIDPGLLEKTQGNNFRARIYPLPAKGTRRIVIAYEQELKKIKDGYQVFLPTEFNETLDVFNVNLLVLGNDIKPKVNNSPWGQFSFEKENEAFVATYSAQKYLAKGQLVFSVPQKRDEKVFVEEGLISGSTVFFSQIYPKIISQSKDKPAHIALFWDASLSMADRNLDMELSLLKAYLKSVENIKVDIHPFNCLPMPVKSFAIKRGNVSDIEAYLRSVVYDGATQLGILDFKQVKANEVLLFSDGLSNFGSNLPILGTVPVNTISTSLKADHSMLQYLASMTGGKYINLTKQEVIEAVPSLLQSAYRLISADYNPTTIKDFTTTIGSINGDTGFSFAGRLQTETAEITLNFGIGGKVLYTEKVKIDAYEKGSYDNMVERIWAQKRINELDLLYEKNKEEIEHLGRSYNIVTRNTSLIVLDRVEDYFLHKITPPAELLDEYNSMFDTEVKVKRDAEKEQIERVVSMFNERKSWWKKDFPKGKPAIYHKSSEQAPPPPPLDGSVDENISISVDEVVGTDEASAVEIVELQEHMVIVEEPEAPLAYRFVPPVIAADEVVRDEDALVMRESSPDTKDKREVNKPMVQARIQLKAWEPDMPYLSILKAKSDKELYDAYIQIRKEYASSPSFYLDVATLFEERGMKREALIILSNLAELEVENYRMLRVLAHRLHQLGYLDYAISQFEKVLKLRPEEPQSYRDLASVLEQNKEYQEAIDKLYAIVEKSWDGRFPGIELIAAEEMNRVIFKAKENSTVVSLDKIDNRLLFNMPVDVRIVLNWDTDNSDMDLWVTDPYGERCFYGNNKTRIGGIISRDFVSGYGPEEFLIKKAINGKYVIQANYYGSREQTLLGPTTIYLDIYTRYAGQEEKKETITLRLTENKEVIDIGEIVFSEK